MGRKETYLGAIENGIDLSEGITQKRNAVIREIKEFGDACETALRSKYASNNIHSRVAYLPPVAGAAREGVEASHIVALQIVMESQTPTAIPVLSCAFECAGAYPCVLATDNKAVICANLTEVKNTLLSFCDDVGPALFNAFDRFKREAAQPTANDNVVLRDESTCNTSATASSGQE